MASADVDSLMSDVSKLFFCHSCSREMMPKLPEYLCSACDSGFIEELEERTDMSQIAYDTHDTQAESSIDVDDWRATLVDPVGGRGRRRRPGSQLRMRHHGPSVMFQFGQGGPGSFQMTSGGPNASIDTFIHQLFSNLGVQVMHGNMPGGMNFGGGGAMGDYAWGPNGLDNIITQLLNQLDNTGPPPADKTKIQSLPVGTVTQKEVDDKVECAVCRDEYTLSEQVKRLPCSHIFHPACVDPWLELHDSCPICRCNLNGERPASDS